MPDAPAEAVLAHRERAQLAEAGAELAEGGAANDLAPRDRDREVGEPFPQRGRGPVQQQLALRVAVDQGEQRGQVPLLSLVELQARLL